jgi:uncharacterized protein YjbJ (UPF0337 family)
VEYRRKEHRVYPPLRKERIMNSDQLKGAWKELKGEIQRQWGEFTDDDLLRIEGDYNRFLGTIQKRYGDRKEEVKKWAEQWLKDHGEWAKAS